MACVGVNVMDLAGDATRDVLGEGATADFGGGLHRDDLIALVVPARTVHTFKGLDRRGRRLKRKLIVGRARYERTPQLSPYYPSPGLPSA